VLQIYGVLLQIYGYEPTDLWSSATEIWCYPQAPFLIATDLWSGLDDGSETLICYRFMVLTQTARFCYKNMVRLVLLQIYGCQRRVPSRLHRLHDEAL